MSQVKQIEKRIKKFLIKIGLKKPIVLPLELSEGHLGGYVIGRPAPGTWCPEIWDWCIGELGVRSMVDVGCGLGYVLEYFDRGGVEVLGVDGSPSAISTGVLPDRVRQHDFTHGPWAPEKPYDLVWSTEFIEHVEQQYEPNFLKTFGAATKYLMITFAVPGQQGHHHVNLQYEDYWIDRMKELGFSYAADLTQTARELLPQTGMRGMQFREKGLVFKRD